MFDRLARIDALTIQDHSYLVSNDRCFYMGEFTSNSGYTFSNTNQLIFNLKKKMSRRGTAEWRYKEEAINTVACDLKRILQAQMEGPVFVPVPPSKTKNHAEYDDRLIRILTKMGQGYNLNLQELVLQRRDMPASHESEHRPTPTELYDNYISNSVPMSSAPTHIIIFDDVLTAGAHHKAMQRKLLDNFPSAKITGLFIARRILPICEN